jgi:hypothetical protein
MPAPLSPRIRTDTLSGVDNQDRDDDVPFEVIRYAEELVGEDRFAGAWMIAGRPLCSAWPSSRPKPGR